MKGGEFSCVLFLAISPFLTGVSEQLVLLPERPQSLLENNGL